MDNFQAIYEEAYEFFLKNPYFLFSQKDTTFFPIGLCEFYEFFKKQNFGERAREKLINDIFIKTRKYAKRQQTWFSREKLVNEYVPFDFCINNIIFLLQNNF